jgi:hypothetical protein
MPTAVGVSPLHRERAALGLSLAGESPVLSVTVGRYLKSEKPLALFTNASAFRTAFCGCG